MSREEIKNRESIFSFEDPAFYEKRDLGGVEVSFPKGETLGRLFVGKGLSAEGKAFAEKFFKEVTHEAPKEDQASLFEVVHSLLSDEGEEGVLKKLLDRSAQLHFKPLESHQALAEEKKEISFDDLASYEKKNLGGVEVTFPREATLEQLLLGKKFSSKGRQFAKHFFGEVMREVPEGFDLDDIRFFIKTLCDQMSRGGKEGVLRESLDQFVDGELDRLARIKDLEMLSASNSPFLEVSPPVSQDEPVYDSAAAAASSISVKHLLGGVVEEIVKEEGGVLPENTSKETLSAFLEEKLAESLEEEGGDIVEVVESFNTSPLREEFREQMSRVPTVQRIEEVIAQGVSREARETQQKGGWLGRIFGEKIGAKVGLVLASTLVALNTWASSVPAEKVSYKHVGDPQVVRRVLTEEKRETIRSVAVEKDERNIGSYYYKFKGEENEKNKRVAINVVIPRVDIDTTRWHTATSIEGFDKTGPMDRPSIYVGGSGGGTEFEGGLSWDRVYDKEGKPTEEFAYRIFLRAPGVSPTGWINPKVGSENNLYFREGENVKIYMERRENNTMVLVVKGENKNPVELSFSLPDTSYPSYKYVIALDQFIENEDGLREGNEGRRARPTRTTISNLDVKSAGVELEDGTTQPLGFFSSHNTVIVPGDVVPPPFRISGVNTQTGAFSCTIDTQGPAIAGVSVTESR